MTTKHKPYGPYEKYIKRLMDCFLSVLAIIILSPILFLIAILIKIKLGSPVLFIQDRPGLNGKIFKLYKFRSMTDTRDENGELLPDIERLTPFGRKLRSTSLDELPELFNIAKGDMAIVGPRPLLVKYLPYYNKRDLRRHDVRPGLTGLAQVSGRNALTWGEKFKKDVEYVDRITFLEDIKIVLLTVKKIFEREGIEFNDGHRPVMEYFQKEIKD